nr:DUF2993 domain-containing protein [Auraticoccus cholistanensis]
MLVLALLAVGLVVADRVAEGVAEDRAAAQVQHALGTAVPPQVDVTGTPFLTQLLAGELERVKVSSGATTVGSGAQQLSVERLQLDLQQVRSSDGFTTSVAGRLDGSADVGYAEISRLAGEPVSPGEVTDAGTRWVVAHDAELFGVDVPIEVSGLPVLDGAYGRQLVLTDVRLNVASYDIPDALAESITAAVVRPVPLELPLGLGADALRSTPEGMSLDFSGTDVDLSTAG